MRGDVALGITFEAAQFLSLCENAFFSKERVDFTKTITLGRLWFFLTKADFEKLIKRYCFEKYSLLDDEQKRTMLDELGISKPGSYGAFSEPYIKMLSGDYGKGSVDSLDCSDYEDATILHDLSVPIHNDLKNRFTCVFDGGTLEHVFNFPIALKNALDMTSIGGHVVFATPANNAMGHGLYQFSPDLFYSVLCEKNGFKDTKVYLNNNGKWYFVKPEMLCNATVSPRWDGVYLYVVSKKIGEVPENMEVYQSSYGKVWSQVNDKPESYKRYDEANAFSFYLRLPLRLRKILRNIYEKAMYRRRFRAMICKVVVPPEFG